MEEQRELAQLFAKTLFEYLYRAGFTPYRTSKASIDDRPSINVNDREAKRCLLEFFNTFYLPPDDPLILRFHTLGGRIRPWSHSFPEPKNVMPALADPDMFVRFTAITILAKIGWPAIGHLLSTIEGPDPVSAGGAAHAIGILAARGEFGRGVEAVDTVVNGLGKPSMRVFGAKIVDALIHMLSHASGYAQASAAGALGPLRQQRTVPSLLQAFNSSYGPTRCLSIESLGLIGGEQAFQAVLDALGHQDAETRESAAMALGQLRDPRALSKLKEVARFWNVAESGSVKRAAREAMKRIGGA
jgi:hypothetical protein